MKSKTFTSIELKRALDLGYKIDKIHSALQYNKQQGLMNNYVQKNIKIKIKCSGKLDQDKCDEINKIHKEMGLDINLKSDDTEKTMV